MKKKIKLFNAIPDDPKVLTDLIKLFYVDLTMQVPVDKVKEVFRQTNMKILEDWLVFCHDDTRTIEINWFTSPEAKK